MTDPFAHGAFHQAGEDLQAALRSDPDILPLWEGLTPLGRNEFICWIDDAKQAATRQRRIVRMQDELLAGKKRPCCWAGCIHRTDKAPGRWQQAVLIDGKRKIPRRDRHSRKACSPAQAGVQSRGGNDRCAAPYKGPPDWTPAFAGETNALNVDPA